MDGMFLDKRFNREFRIVRDNRFNQNANLEAKPPLVQSSTPRNKPVVSNTSGTSHSAGTSGNQKPPLGCFPSLSSGTDRKEIPEKRPLSFPNTALLMQAVKPNDSRPRSTTSSSSSVVGLYSSSSDPVHVPSLDSRPATNVGIIKREVGIVGVCHQPSENPVNISSAQTSSSLNSNLGWDGTSKESFRYFNAISKSDQLSQTAVSESVISSMSVSRSFLNNHYSNRPHQQPVGRQKAPQPNKEWKPKSSQKASIIGGPAKSVSPPADHSEDSETDVAQLQDKLSQINISVNQKVIIAPHLRVSEAERCRLTFGSLGAEFESSRSSRFLAVVGVEASSVGPSASLLESASETSGKETPGSKQEVHLVDGYVRNSGSNSPASAGLKHQLADKKESSSPPNLDHHGDIGLVQDSSPSCTPSKSQQLQDPTELPDFSAYDPPTGYDTPYFKPTVDESVRGQGLPFPQEQHPMTQMYPQVRVSHFGNLMPYRQFISPVYGPPMAMPGYSSNPAYPHPSNGNSYLLMPGGSSHLTAGGLKYGMQQFKPVPSGSPTGYRSFTSPTGYAINAPRGVGNATGLEDSSWLKYNDSNLYVPNPQAETSEIWMNQRDAPSLQSASYYNMTAQTPHAAYLPSHNGHTSFNPAAAVAQSSHMQFPGLYHPPPQPTPHHMSPAASAMRW